MTRLDSGASSAMTADYSARLTPRMHSGQTTCATTTKVCGCVVQSQLARQPPTHQHAMGELRTANRSQANLQLSQDALILLPARGPAIERCG